MVNIIHITFKNFNYFEHVKILCLQRGHKTTGDVSMEMSHSAQNPEKGIYLHHN